MTKKQYNDPNIGVLRINRVNTTGRRLVGSAVKANNYITIDLFQGKAESSLLDKEHIYPQKLIAEIAMTPMQWGEFVSSFTLGSGSPCTIDILNGKQVKQSYKSEAVDDFYEEKTTEVLKETSEKFNNAMSDAIDILQNKKSITKKDRQDIISAYNTLSNLMADSLPFLKKQMVVDMESHIHQVAGQLKYELTEDLKQQRELLDQQKANQKKLETKKK